MSKNTIIKGTLILTAAGLLTRIIGFFYKIYLSNLIGARNLGVYQLVFPVYGICFTLYASGIQTALSKLIAEETGKNTSPKQIKRFLFHAILLSMGIALFLSFIVFSTSDYIAVRLLEEADCAKPLRILSFIFPFCAITSCINGYYYGLKRASVPAFSQLLEQIIRVGAVLFLVSFFPTENIKQSCELAVFGLVAGEIASQFCNLISLLFPKRKPSIKLKKNYDIKNNSSIQNTNQNTNFSKNINSNKNANFNKNTNSNKNTNFTKNTNSDKNSSLIENNSPVKDNLPKENKTISSSCIADLKLVFFTSLPLTLNRLLVNLLHSFETVLIPKMLRATGLTQTEALSICGILNGMTFPFLMFPSTITNSLSVLLLPAISEANAKKNQRGISETSSLTIKYSLLLGILSAGIFLTFGEELGIFVYKEPSAGIYLTILAWICPFLYVATTLGSIINGLGKMNLTFLNSILGQVLHLILIVTLIPRYGMRGYFISFLVSQLFITFIDFIIVYKYTKFPFHAWNTLLKPSLILVIVCSFSHRFFEFLLAKVPIHNLILLLGSVVFLCVCYLILLFAAGVINFKEWKKF